MADRTKIEWTDHTFNPWTGCTKVSPGCINCYAEGWAKRSGLVEWGPKAERRITSDANWRQPRKWDREAAAAGRRAKVFCASLADVFERHPSIPSTWRIALWGLIEETPHLDWLLLTKRTGNIAACLPGDWGTGWPNVWLGTTVENQEQADQRIPHLLAVPAAKRFVSAEPLLGPINLLGGGNLASGAPRGGYYWMTERPCPVCKEEDEMKKARGAHSHPINCGWRKDQGSASGGIDWVIVGGESAPHARPMHPDWAQSLRDQCQAAGVPFFMKQMAKKGPIPEDLMIREMPNA